MLSAWIQAARKIKAKREDVVNKYKLACKLNTRRLLKVHFSLWLTSSRNKVNREKSPAIRAEVSTANDENRQPNVILSPLSSKKKAPSFNSPTPKLVQDMEARRKEREQRRQILKSLQDEKQRQRRDQEEAKRKQKEEEDCNLHKAYLRQKSEEEKRKQMEIARRKQACQLAGLHYRVGLCRRVFKQWTKVFQLIAFNERKVSGSEFILLSKRIH